MKKLIQLQPKTLKISLIGIPLLLMVLYFCFFSADRYVSESVIAVHEESEGVNALAGVASLFGTGNLPSNGDALYLQQYLISLDVLNKLEDKLKIREHYESEKWDIFYRLWPHSSQEWFLSYYRSRVTIQYDTSASLLTIDVQAFTPEYAKKINEFLLVEADSFINEYSHKLSRDEMAFSEQELHRADEMVQTTTNELLEFQAKNKILNPLLDAQASSTLTASMQTQISKMEAELKNLRSYLHEDAYEIKFLRNQLDAMHSQMAIERTRATTGSGDSQINLLTVEFQKLQAKVNMATDEYKVALVSMEKSRIDATRKIKGLVIISSPNKAELAAYPERLYDLFTLFVATWLIYAIVRLVLATIREHQD